MSTESVLVFCERSDIHSFAVHHCLTLLGQKSHLILPQALAGTGQISIDLRDEDPQIVIGDFVGRASNVKSVYNRRLPHDYEMPNFAAEVDKPYIESQLKSAIIGILAVLDANFPVNPISSAFYTANKINQLKTAKTAGFKVPDTVIGAYIGDIAKVFGTDTSLCTKSIDTYCWQSGTEFLTAFTARIENFESIDPRAIALNPNIYQSYIHKKFEYRLTVFGNYAAAVKINNQILSSDEAVDWRSSKRYLDNLEPAYLPDAIVNAAKKVLLSLGLRFGTFDIVEDNDGEFYFLEVNESGAFLWMEECCEGVRVLEPFARFLIEASEDFSMSPDWCSNSLGVETVLASSNQFDGFDPHDPMSSKTKIKFWAEESENNVKIS